MEEKNFSALGYGSFRPLIDVETLRSLNREDKREARATNRRVEIYLDAFLKQKIGEEVL